MILMKPLLLLTTRTAWDGFGLEPPVNPKPKKRQCPTETDFEIAYVLKWLFGRSERI
jgi:hypothetical protein